MLPNLYFPCEKMGSLPVLAVGKRVSLEHENRACHSTSLKKRSTVYQQVQLCQSSPGLLTSTKAMPSSHAWTNNHLPSLSALLLMAAGPTRAVITSVTGTHQNTLTSLQIQRNIAMNTMGIKPYTNTGTMTEGSSVFHTHSHTQCSVIHTFLRL